MSNRNPKNRMSEWSRSVVSDSVTPWTVAHQAPLSTGFSRQEYWSGLLFPSPGDLPDPGIKPRSPAPQADPFPSEPQGSHCWGGWCYPSSSVFCVSARLGYFRQAWRVESWGEKHAGWLRGVCVCVCVCTPALPLHSAVFVTCGCRVRRLQGSAMS